MVPTLGILADLHKIFLEQSICPFGLPSVVPIDMINSKS